MFLDYFALGVLIFVFLVIFYGIIILHDIPYLIAKKRNHPHADAIHVADWPRITNGDLRPGSPAHHRNARLNS